MGESSDRSATRAWPSLVLYLIGVVGILIAVAASGYVVYAATQTDMTSKTDRRLSLTETDTVGSSDVLRVSEISNQSRRVIARKFRDSNDATVVFSDFNASQLDVWSQHQYYVTEVNAYEIEIESHNLVEVYPGIWVAESAVVWFRVTFYLGLFGVACLCFAKLLTSHLWTRRFYRTTALSMSLASLVYVLAVSSGVYSTGTPTFQGSMFGFYVWLLFLGPFGIFGQPYKRTAEILGISSSFETSSRQDGSEEEMSSMGTANTTTEDTDIATIDESDVTAKIELTDDQLDRLADGERIRGTFQDGGEFHIEVDEDASEQSLGERFG